VITIKHAQLPITVFTESNGVKHLSSDFYTSFYEFFRDTVDTIDPTHWISFTFQKDGKPWGCAMISLDVDAKILFTTEPIRLVTGRLIGTYWGRWLFTVKKKHKRDMSEPLEVTFNVLGAPDTLKIAYPYRPIPLSLWERL